MTWKYDMPSFPSQSRRIHFRRCELMEAKVRSSTRLHLALINGQEASFLLECLVYVVGRWTLGTADLLS